MRLGRMFCGREAELEKLEEAYASGRFEFIPVWGRRRVGKSSLLKKFFEGKRGVYFNAVMGDMPYNLKALASAVVGAEGVTMEFRSILDLVGEKSRDERYVLILDEFPYLQTSDGSVSGHLQNFIDGVREESKLMLVVCGSSVSMMERELLGGASPLFGRRTGGFRLRPMTFVESRCLLKGFSLEDQVLIYGMVGGVPPYLREFDPSVSLEENVRRNFLSGMPYFDDEAYMTLREDFPNPYTYFSILAALSEGLSRNAEISRKVGLEPPRTAKYLADLQSIGLVAKVSPVDRPNGKMTRYVLVDEFMRFFFRHLYTRGGALYGDGHAGTDVGLVMSDARREAGSTFEKICAQHLCRRLEAEPGTWWGGDPETGKAEEIDIVLSRRTTDGVAGWFVECKYRNEKTGVQVLDDLVRKSKLVKGFDESRYVLCSKSGFTGGFEGRDVTLLTLEDVAERPGNVFEHRAGFRDDLK